jgi:hypothetical protein
MGLHALSQSRRVGLEANFKDATVGKQEHECSWQAWLTDVLERMVSGRTKATKLERLLPWAWKAEQLEATADA